MLLKKLTSTLFILGLLFYSQTFFGQTSSVFYDSTAGNSTMSGDNNAFFGYYAGESNTTGHGNAFFGTYSGNANTIGFRNSFFGKGSGGSNTTGENNTFLGYLSGTANTTGFKNIFIGTLTGRSSTSGTDNTYIGVSAGYTGTATVRNVYIGNVSGRNNANGSNNTFLGYDTGYNSDGSSNVFIGHRAGRDATGDNQLYISNDTNSDLIYGDFDTKQVVIGSDTIPQNISTSTGKTYALFVPRGILTEEVKVKVKPWPDYVFEENYDLCSLEEEEDFIESNGHLMNFPSAEQIDDEGGVDLGKMIVLQQETIEKLMLHVIRLEKELDGLKEAK